MPSKIHRRQFPRIVLGALLATSTAAATLVTGAAAAAASVTASVHTDGDALNIRTGPSSSTAVVGLLANGAAISVSCQVDGQTVSGAVRRTAQWDKLTKGGYVSDAYVRAGSSIPSCSSLIAAPVTYAGKAHTDGGLTLSCAASGTFVNGAVHATSQWDRLANGNYVSHAYVEASATLPSCAGSTPGSGGAGPVGSQTNAQFIASAVGPAQQGYREFKVPASVTIAQAILESGWGRSKLTANDRNYFGIKCFSGSAGPIANGCHTYSTYECEPTCAPTYASFRTYASITDSFRDHGRFLTTNSRYRPAFGYTGDADQFIYQVWKAGYATSPTYVDNVKGLMHQYNLYQYDR
jgi:flagellum-specific peptidoglycan hydrolase FlgJ/uncharacterized protein YraI